MPDDASLQEQTAAEELQDYLLKITSAKFTIIKESSTEISGPRLFVGRTQKARELNLLPDGDEAWRIKTCEGGVVLCGGAGRGTLYAVYHFLEDHLGVRWWNPQEEFVPHSQDLSVGPIDRCGRPAFARRAMNMNMTGYDPPIDGAAFVSRSRMNARGPGEGAIAPKYGCNESMLLSSRPWCAHSFDSYIPNREGLFKEHPEYFALRGGKRTKATYDLTAGGLRDLFAEKLKQLILRDQAASNERGTPRPLVYHFSKEDEPNLYSESPESTAIRMREGSESGVMLDFVNDQARRVAEYDGDVVIETLAYQNTEEPPKRMRCDDNVLITLCDTQSLVTLPATHPRNAGFLNKLRGWAKITRHLRIWDYGYCHMPDSMEYPIPTEFTYQPDYQLFLDHRVQGIFTQYETFPGVVLGDMADMKRWLICKLMEDPGLDFDALSAQFMDGYYGPAGKVIARYRNDLMQSARRNPPGYTILCGTEHTTLHYLDFIVRAKKYFQEAQDACNGDEVLLRRVRHARASLDAAEIARYSLLKRRYLLEGGEPATFPLDLVSAVERLKQTMTEQAQQRLDKAKLDKTVGRMAEKLDLYASMNRDWPLPEQFRGYKAHELVEFTPPAIPRVVAPAQVVGDPTSECGLAIRVPLADSLEPDSIILKAGIHQQSGMPTKVVVSEGLPLSYKDATSSPGYHWRKLLGNAQVQSDSKFFVAMPTCWNVQFQCDRPMSSGKSGQYDFWGRVKVERSTTQDENGANEKEYLYLERVLMVRTR